MASITAGTYSPMPAQMGSVQYSPMPSPAPIYAGNMEVAATSELLAAARANQADYPQYRPLSPMQMQMPMSPMPMSPMPMASPMPQGFGGGMGGGMGGPGFGGPPDMGGAGLDSEQVATKRKEAEAYVNKRMDDLKERARQQYDKSRTMI